jgi:pimeloyl-ACP methyl ester carboxylesterase
LVFDYRYFGDSEGQPRELLSIARQREDWQAALRFVRSLPDVDSSRVVLWGTSFGGGHVIATAAVDHEVVAAIAQCPFTDGLASVLEVAPRESARLILAGAKDRLAQLAARKPVRVKVAARPGELGLMNDAEAVDTVIALLGASGLTEAEYRNEVPARIALEIVFDAPGRKASQIQCPILFCVCDADTVAPAKATLRHAARAPRGEIQRYPVGHFDIYIGELFERVVADQLAFLHAHVPTAATN